MLEKFYILTLENMYTLNFWQRTHYFNLQVQPPRSGEYPGGKWVFGLQLASPLHHQGGRSED